MNNIFLKEKNKLGVIIEDPDVRNIDYTQAHPIVSAIQYPTEYKTDISKFPVLNQTLGICVACAFAIVKGVLDYIETGNVILYSRRFLYATSRRFMKYENTNDINNQGLPPIATAKVLTTIGVLKGNEENDDFALSHSRYVNEYPILDEKRRKEANIGRAKGFTNVQITPEALKYAIMNAKVIPATIFIDWSKFDFDGVLHPYKTIQGSHEIFFYGWEVKNGRERFIFRNSWSKNWGTNGDGYVYSDELDGVVHECLAITDVPNDLVERAKGYQYIFITDLKFGSTGTAVMQLQKRLIEYGIATFKSPTGYFGLQTQNAVKEYQKLKGISQTGNFYSITREKMNADVAEKKVKSKLDLWIEAITKMEGAKPENNNPGNIRYVGQKKAIGQTYNGFCLFATYADGYTELKNLLIRACTGQSKYYKPDMNIVEFYHVYAPSSDGNNPDHYGKFVAKYIGVPETTLIKDLL